VRGQLLFSLIMGTTAGIALWIFGLLGIFPDGRTYALAFGAFFGAMELVPYLGPVLGALPPVLVALLGDPLTALWVGLLFLALQQLEATSSPRRCSGTPCGSTRSSSSSPCSWGPRSTGSSGRSSRCRSRPWGARRWST